MKWRGTEQWDGVSTPRVGQGHHVWMCNSTALGPKPKPGPFLVGHKKHLWKCHSCHPCLDKDASICCLLHLFKHQRIWGLIHTCVFTVASVFSWQQWKSYRTLLNLPRVSAKQAILKYFLLYFALCLNGTFTLKIPLKYLTFVCWVTARLNHYSITSKHLFY